ncbi:hypothetical protein CEP54_014945 [Fusarium duplospermum]|uniref:C2H2-type domain-containing protein n=1 Tax=Fusarium duplospermum TaxID=1325734 RepID=A0A428NSJ5_9HYPO|nr:hypothetical protein CEP54_014945 [Fusarium duplospermum]
MAGREADKFSYFNYLSRDVSNDSSTLGWPSSWEYPALVTPDNLTAFGNTSCDIATTRDLERSQGQQPATNSEQVPLPWNYESSAQYSGQGLLPLFPQQNCYWSTTYSMDEAVRTNEQPNAGSLIPIDGASELLEQTGNGTIPPNPSALERQEDNHNLQQRCPHSSCTNKSFRDKGTLDRHMREVHSSQTFFCPVVSCRRNKRGFNRRYNLLDHQKRRHGQNIPGISEGRLQHIHGDQTFREEDDASEPTLDGSAKSLRLLQNEGTTNEEGLWVKLESLRVMREEIDEDIKALEKALSIISNEH